MEARYREIHHIRNISGQKQTVVDDDDDIKHFIFGMDTFLNGITAKIVDMGCKKYPIGRRKFIHSVLRKLMCVSV